MSVRTRFNLALGAIGLCVCLVQGLNVLGSWTELQHVEVTSGVIQDVSSEALQLGVAIDDLRFHVVQVQQFLQDISATRGLDGLDGGLDEAARHAAGFTASLSTAREEAGRLGLVQVTAALAEVEAAFGPYYAMGQKLAQAYIASGPAGGNPLMVRFDEAASRMTDGIEALRAANKQAIDASLARLAASNAAVQQEASKLGWLSGIFALLVVAGCAAIWRILDLQIVRPLIAVTASMRRLAEGDLSVDVTASGRNDEIGELTQALGTFKRAAEARLAAEAAAAAALQREQRDRRQTMLSVADRLQAAVGGAVGIVADQSRSMQEIAGRMTLVAGSLSEKSVAVSGSSARAGENIHSVASAAEQLSAAIGAIAEQTAQSVHCTGAAVESGKRTSARVEELTQAASRIGQVVEIIAGIAEQTNLLALNATIEAARAGEAGRGFAVVAAEVKQLSVQTARATSEISSYIDAIRAATNETVKDMKEGAVVIAQINEIGTMIAGAVEEQRASTREIAQHVDNAARGTRQIAGEIEGVDASAREVDQSARSVLQNATKLTEQSEVLRNEVARFLEHVRAA